MSVPEWLREHLVAERVGQTEDRAQERESTWDFVAAGSMGAVKQRMGKSRCGCKHNQDSISAE